MSSELKRVRRAVLPGALISVASFSFVAEAPAGEAEDAWRELMAAWGGPAFVPGEIVVCFREGVSESDIVEAVKKTGGEIIRRGAFNPRRVVISVPEGEEGTYADAYGALREVRTAERNYVLEAQPAAGGPDAR